MLRAATFGLLLAGIVFPLSQCSTDEEPAARDESRSSQTEPPTSVDMSPPEGIEAGVVTGKVRVLAGSDLPSTPLSVRVFRTDALWWESVLEPLAEVEVDTEGRFRFDDLPDTALTLSIEAPGYSPLVRQLDLRMSAAGRVGLDLALESCPALAGLVRDSEGRALAGAEVVVVERRGRRLVGSGLPHRTDERGRFDIRSTPAGVLAVYVRHPRFVPVVAEPVAPGRDDLVIELSSSGASTLEVRLLERETADALGTHAISVRDLEILAPGTGRWRTSTGADGTVRFSSLRPGAHQVVVEPSETHDGQEAMIELARGTQREVLNLPRTAQMKAQVVDGRTRRPIPKARLRFDQSQGPFDDVFEADEQGRVSFRFPVRSLSPFEIRLASEDQILEAAEMPDGVLAVPPGEGPPAHVVPLSAIPAARIMGRVTSPADNALVGAEVIAVRRTPTGVIELARAGTGTDGRFVLGALPAGKDLFLWAQGGDSAPTEVGPIETRSGQVSGPVPLRLDTGGRLSGRVVDAAGEGVFGARVLARSARPKAGWTESITASGPDGGFVFESLPLVSLEVVATFGELAPGRQAGVRLDRSPRTDGLIVMLGPPSVIRGRVEDPEGDAIAGVPVLLLRGGTEWARTISDSGGHFSFSSLDPGRYQVRTGPTGSIFSQKASLLWRTEEGPHIAEVGPGDDPLVLKLPRLPLGHVTFRLELGDGAPPPERAALELQPLPITTPPLQVGLSELGREVRLTGIDPGRYRLTLQPAGYVPQSRAIEVLEDQDLDLGVWSFERGRSIRGRVFDETGRPIPGAVVIGLSSPRPQALDLQSASIASGEDGRFVLSGLSSQITAVYARAAGHAPQSLPLSPDTESIEVRLLPAARLAIVLPELEVAPDSSRQLRVIELVDGDQFLIAERSFDASVHRTRLDDLPIGRFRIELAFENESLAPIVREVTTSAGETREVNLGESGR